MDWNARYENLDTPWDKGAPAPILEKLLSDHVISSTADVLVPGCGYGHDVRELVAAGCSVTGLDISKLALDVAREMTTEPQNVTWAEDDFFDPELPLKKRYDVIWEHTCYCAIPPDMRRDYVTSAHNLLKPNGILVGVFFIAPQTKPGPPHMTCRDDLMELFSAKFELVWERAPEVFYPAREGKEWLMCWRKSG